MIQTYNILSLLLDYPTETLWDNRNDILPTLTADDVLGEDALRSVRTFLDYVATFDNARSWQAAYSDLFDTSTKTNLYLKEEYLKAGLMPVEDELPDYLPMYLQYVASMGSKTEAHAAIDDIRGVLSKMDDRFRKEQHPYEPLIALLKEL